MHTVESGRRRRMPAQLWFWVVVAIAAGAVFGVAAPAAAKEAKWLADAFLQLVKTITAPVIFLTVVVGVASLGNMAKAGGLAARALGFSILRFIRLLKDELLIILGTSSSETVLPRLLVKLERAGASRQTVGVLGSSSTPWKQLDSGADPNGRPSATSSNGRVSTDIATPTSLARMPSMLLR